MKAVMLFLAGYGTGIAASALAAWKVARGRRESRELDRLLLQDAMRREERAKAVIRASLKHHHLESGIDAVMAFIDGVEEKK